MLLNTLKNEKIKKTQKNPLEARFYCVFVSGFFFWFYWAGFLMSTLIFMGLRWQDFIHFKVKH